MKSINKPAAARDGESWTRQRIDFAGLPEMVRTFLQVAAGAADIPVTRLLGQSPAGCRPPGDSDTRNYYDMIAARQEIDLRPQLERLDRFLLASAGVAPSALRFDFRPLWQMDAAAKAAMALQKAQATRIYAGLGLWPAEVMARMVAGQIAADGTYPGGAGVFSVEAADGGQSLRDYSPDQPRDPEGRWTRGGNASTEQPEAAVGEGGPAETPHALTIHPKASQVLPSELSHQTPAPTSSSGILGTIASILQFPNPIGTAKAAEAEGTPIELAAASGKGRARTIAAFLRGLPSLHKSSGNISKVVSRIRRSLQGRKSPPTRLKDQPGRHPDHQRLAILTKARTCPLIARTSRIR